MIHPIWKDYFVDFGQEDKLEYRILADGEEIYHGVAQGRPNEISLKIRINDICADYLEHSFPALVQKGFTTQGEPVTFLVQYKYGDRWDDVDSVQFYNDWSYDYGFNPATMGMSFCPNGRIDVRQWVMYSAFNASSITATITLRDGSHFDVIIPVEISADFNADFNSDFSKSVRATQTGTAVFNLSQWGDIEMLTIGDRVFKVVNGCNRYVLSYINAYGGWDTLLIEGNHAEVDNVVRHTRESMYDNRSIQNRSVHNYANEITKTLTLHTSWMSDEESSRMHHLLNSTEVFLGDLTTGEMIPVVLTNTATEYKTYKGNGGKLVNYAIEVSFANKRVRR